MKVGAQELKGHLDVLLLAALEDGPRHGYAVKEALREGSGGRFDLPTGTIYPALHRLERAGLIAGSWSSVDGRRRYQLTAAADADGERRLHADRNNWREFATASVSGASRWMIAWCCPGSCSCSTPRSRGSTCRKSWGSGQG